MNKELEALEKEIDHEYTQEIVCPHCGSEWTDSWEYGNYNDEDLGLIICDDCEKGFYATRDIEVTYITKKATYGTCRCCKKENVIIDNYRSYSLGKINVDDYCEDCYEKAREKMFKGISTIDLKE